MKKHLAALTVLVVFLSILIPFASSSPDGLEKVAKSLGIEETEPMWRGLMFDYSIEGLENPRLSTLTAGILGILIVFGATAILGATITKRSTLPAQNA
jgi:cobalt/nickel transport protein